MENTAVHSRSQQDRNAYLPQDFDCNTEARCSTCDNLVNVHKWTEHKKACFVKKSERCDLCSFEFNHEANLQIHKLLKHPNGCKECSICKKKFQRESAFRGHVITHFVIDKLCCEHCKDDFDTPVQLSRHRRLQHSSSATMTEALICCVCGEIFSPLELDAHNRRHTYERVLQKKSHSTKKKSKADISKQAIRPHICSVCEKAFRRPKELSRHEAIHSDDRNYKCAYCPMEFRHDNVLHAHEKLHKRINKVYMCRICQHSFNTKYNLHRHLQISHMSNNSDGPKEIKIVEDMDSLSNTLHPIESHTEDFSDHNPVSLVDGGDNAERREEEIIEDEWNALDNGNSSIERREWRWDIDGVNGGDLAEQLFENRESEKDCILVIRENSLRCPACIHSIESIEHMMAHFQSLAANDSIHRLATFTCMFCQKDMMGTEVYSHLSSHGVTPYSCSITSIQSKSRPHICPSCQRSFTKNIDLMRHIRTHTGEKPFRCKVCGERFRVETTLRRHLKMHTDMDSSHDCSICGKGFLNKNALRIHLISHTTPCSLCHKTFNTTVERDDHVAREHSNREMGARNRTGGMFLPSVPGGLATLSQISRPIASKRMLSTGSSAFHSIPSTSHEETRNEKFNVKISAEDTTKEGMVMKISRKPMATQCSTSSHSNQSSLSYSVPHALLSSLQVEGGVLRTPINRGRVVNMHPSETLSALSNTHRMDIHPVESQSLHASLFSAQNHSARSLSFIPIDLNSHNYFVDNCNICDVSFSTKEESDSHMTSEDHETAMLLTPHSGMESSNSQMVCKLCGNRFASMAPLVDHIRREHERDHPKSLAPLNLHTSLLTSSSNHVHS